MKLDYEMAYSWEPDVWTPISWEELNNLLDEIHTQGVVNGRLFTSKDSVIYRRRIEGEKTTD